MSTSKSRASPSTRTMVQVRIPGLDHSLMEDGSWMPDETYYRRNYDYRDPKKNAATRKTERQSDERGGVAPLRHAVADG